MTVDELVVGIDVVKNVENVSEVDRVFEKYGAKINKNVEGQLNLVIFVHKNLRISW